MSVIVTISMYGDPAAFERYAGENAETMRGIRDHAVEHGLIAHRFYGSDDGHVMVVDEWPDAESFQHFFGHVQGAIGPMLEAVGVSSEPEVRFWRKLETHDEYGWD